MAHHPRTRSLLRPASPRTVADRLGQTGAIDDVYRAIRALDDPEKIQEGKRIVEQIVALKYEVQHDRQLTYGAFTQTHNSLPSRSYRES